MLQSANLTDWSSPNLPLAVMSAALLVLLVMWLVQKQKCQRYSRWVDSIGEDAVLHLASVEGASEGLWQWDLETDTFRVSKGWAETLGRTPSEIGGSASGWFAMVHPRYLPGLRMDLEAHVEGEKDRFECEYRIRHRNGKYRWVLCRGSAIRDEKGKALQIRGVQTDVTRLVEVENRLVDDALHDRLTGLPNKTFFAAELAQAIEEAQRSSAFRFSVLFLDLDRFKEINDTLGHLIGDKLLAATAKRLRACIRPADLVARFGGDEFIVLLERMEDFSEAHAVATRIKKALTEPFQLAGHHVITSTSVGIVLSDSHYADAEDLIRNADIAMYAANAEGKGQSRVYDRTMYERTHRRWNLENELHGALSREELRIHYQPQICLKTSAVIGAEALLRWTSHHGEIVAPSEFIPLAESSDLILDLGEWVLRYACTEAMTWREDSNLSLTNPRVSVNVSARQLKDPTFPRLVDRVLTQTGLSPKDLDLELTETVMIETLESGPAVVQELAEMGVRLAIDDFGIGYSSISYLTKLDASVIKLDRSLVRDVARTHAASALVKSVICLAHDLDFTVVAEGVEKESQLSFLRANQCDQVQGYLTGHPMPQASFRQLLAKEAQVARTAGPGWRVGPLTTGPFPRPRIQPNRTSASTELMAS